ncbi:hypothetical protein niasHT_025171 [Heterodera trifolii]|uniref:B30.2/SPRY domain-containing protein n=1 Tax=Heterodera trifolii TaxID=157864 RepID=A0ABD2JLA4_9BILA
MSIWLGGASVCGAKFAAQVSAAQKSRRKCLRRKCRFGWAAQVSRRKCQRRKSHGASVCGANVDLAGRRKCRGASVSGAKVTAQVSAAQMSIWLGGASVAAQVSAAQKSRRKCLRRKCRFGWAAQVSRRKCLRRKCHGASVCGANVDISVDAIKNVQQNELNVLEKEHKETKMKMALLNLGKNCWDANACHNELKITDDKCLAVIYEGKACGFRTVFATHPIWHGNNSSGLFYFEISIKDMPNCPYGLFGFAVKNLKKLELALEFGTFGYLNHGNFIINGEGLYREAQKVESYEENDIVGCGVNWANRMIFFTKNGRRQGPFYLLANSPYFFPHQLFPFISLYAGDKIDANFGPNFKFNLATL